MNRLFYVLNSNTNFEFPHMNCDTYSYEDLKKWFLRHDYFLAYMITMFEAKDPGAVLEKLAEKEELMLLGTAWMRLKFMAEVLNPTCIHTHFNKRLKIASAHEWETHAMLRYITVDRYANTFINIVMNSVEAVVNEWTPPEIPTKYVDIAKVLNAELPKIREAPLGLYDWIKCDPHSMAPLPYYTFITSLYSVLASALQGPIQQSEESL
jgi:hypothetical protein